MATTSRGAHAVRGLLRTSSSTRLCTQCARTGAPLRAPLSLSTSSAAFNLATRSYSGAAAAEVTTNAGTPINPPPTSPIPSEPKASSGKQAYRIKSGVILTRAPLLTQLPTPLEESFYFYQKRLNERLTMPFVTKVYFKPDTPSIIDWNMKVKDRKGTVAKDIGLYHGKTSESWNDELKVGDQKSSHEHIYNTLLEDATMRVSDDAEYIPPEDRVPPEQPLSRESEADKKGDVKRLDRAMDRTLYLVVKNKDGKWEFPASGLSTEDNLHEAARVILDKTAGVDMNTWIIGRAPVAHYVERPTYKQETGELEKRGEKTFFLKGRIMAGQANLNGNPYGYSDFQWLTREELQAQLDPAYYHGVRNMMADR